MTLRLIYLLSLMFIISACTGDSQNKLQRMGVQFLDGNYKVTFAEGSHTRVWQVINGKVTSVPEKGYYFFWANQNGQKIYVQSPISRTYIEELGARN